MKEYRYETEVTITEIAELESVKRGFKTKDDKAVLEYNPPVWVIKTGPPYFLSWTVDNKPPFEAGVQARISLEVTA